MNINMELYKVFYTVANCKNISKAAEILFISQPAISKSIKKLEDALGIPLFIRNSRGVRLTNEGSIFFDYVKKAMTELSLGINILDKIKTNEYGSLKMSVSTILCKHLLLPHLKTYINLNPNVKIQIFNRSTFETLKLIDEGIIDFGLVSQPFGNQNYKFIKLMDIHDVFIACNSYIQNHDIMNSANFFTDHTIMLLEEDNITRKYINKYLILNNITAKPEIETGNMDVLIEFAKLGLGITVLIKEFIQEDLNSGNLSELPITPPIPPRAVGIVYHKNFPLSLASKEFIDHLTNHYSK